MKNRYRQLVVILIIVSMAIFTIGCSNSTGNENEDSITSYNKTDIYDMVTNGAHVILVYQSLNKTFIGSVTNVSNELLSDVSIKIRLSTGRIVGPYKPDTINIDETLDFHITTSDDGFLTWSVVVETG